MCYDVALRVFKSWGSCGQCQSCGVEFDVLISGISFVEITVEQSHSHSQHVLNTTLGPPHLPLLVHALIHQVGEHKKAGGTLDTHGSRQESVE